MDWGMGSRVLSILYLSLLFLQGESSTLELPLNEYDYNQELCTADLGKLLPPPYSNLPNSMCKPIWNSFEIMYSQTDHNVVTIILSASYSSGWIGIGFSQNGKMVNSSAMIGWMNEESFPTITQYFLQGSNSSQIFANKGSLPLTKAPPFAILHGTTMFLAFQMKFPTPLLNQPILLAIGNDYPIHGRLTPHQHKKTVWIDFSTGNKTTEYGHLKSRNLHMGIQIHGMLGLFGWGLVMPYGAVLARHLSRKNRYWYFLHVTLQMLGFLAASAGVGLGLLIREKLRVHIPAHEGIGLFALSLAILQVFALFVRPSTGTRARVYWNIYHTWVGRVALLFGGMNIILGFEVGGAGLEWKICYGIILGTVLLSCIVLEALYMLRASDKQSQHPTDKQSKHPTLSDQLNNST